MQMILVDSTSIYAVGYENGTMVVEFHSSNTVYTHYGVPYSVYVAFMNARSLGAYYNQFIRGQYG